VIHHASLPVADLERSIALAAPSREAVDAFHAAALHHGATDNGRPGPRPHDGPRYYAAFVVDLDGHRIEAVHNT
jgi:predicted lactoylglutathione lyase